MMSQKIRERDAARAANGNNVATKSRAQAQKQDETKIRERNAARAANGNNIPTNSRAQAPWCHKNLGERSGASVDRSHHSSLAPHSENILRKFIGTVNTQGGVQIHGSPTKIYLSTQKLFCAIGTVNTQGGVQIHGSPTKKAIPLANTVNFYRVTMQGPLKIHWRP